MSSRFDSVDNARNTSDTPKFDVAEHLSRQINSSDHPHRQTDFRPDHFTSTADQAINEKFGKLELIEPRSKGFYEQIKGYSNIESIDHAIARHKKDHTHYKVENDENGRSLTVKHKDGTVVITRENHDNSVSQEVRTPDGSVQIIREEMDGSDNKEEWHPDGSRTKVVTHPNNSGYSESTTAQGQTTRRIWGESAMGSWEVVQNPDGSQDFTDEQGGKYHIKPGRNLNIIV